MTTRGTDPYSRIGERLARHQRGLRAQGLTLRDDIEARYLDKWRSERLYHVSRVRTALVSGMLDFCIEAGLVNLERVSMSLITDPLAHAVDHLPVVPYGGADYVTTHSMIYAKLMACHNPHLRGVFVDSPNLRLEPKAPDGRQRGRYLLDFSQVDIEIKREGAVDLDAYLDKPDDVTALLREDLTRALRFFEGVLRAGLEQAARIAGESLRALGARVDLPSGPLPIFYRDEAEAAYGADDLDAKIGAHTDAQAFFVVGLMRENYDLIYPYLRREGTPQQSLNWAGVVSFNYDICVKGRREDGSAQPAREVLSGGLREWLPESIVARLLDNRVIPEAPVVKDGEIQNLEALGGYGPFLALAVGRDREGRPTFPATMGGGFGVERLLWALLQGPTIQGIEDVTFFGKNPDSADMFLF